MYSTHNHPLGKRVKLILALAVLLLLPTFADAQTEKVKLSSRQMTISEALSEINQQTGYRFALNRSKFNISRNVTFTAVEASVAELVEQMLAGSGYSYVLAADKYLLLVPADKQKDGSPVEIIDADRSSLAYVRSKPVKSDGKTDEDWDTILRQVGDSLILFRFVPGQALFYSPYRGNDESIARMSSLIEANREDILAGRKMVRVNGYCTSYETSTENLQVAKERSNHVKSRFIVYDGMKEENYRTFNSGKSWNGFSDIVTVVFLDTYPNQSEPANVVSEPEPTPVAEPEAAPKEEPQVVQTQEPAVSEPAPVAVVPSATEFRPMLGIKTNLLTWASIMPDFKHYNTYVPNLEVEYYFADKWSVAASGAYADWSAGGNKYFAVSDWSVEPRYWFNNDGRFRWFYAGVYGQMGDYDNQNLHIDDFGNTGDYFGGGVSLGAMIPLGNRFGFELGIRGGYLNRELKAYSYSTEDAAYYLESKETKNEWGIMGIKASLLFRIGRK